MAETNFKESLDAFLAYDCTSLQQGDFEEARKRIVNSFHSTVEKVPAYRQFLQDHNVHPTSIKTYEDFVARVPLVNKANYIKKYPLAARCVNGDISVVDFMHTSSGSTGEPTVWARNQCDELVTARLFDRLFTALGSRTKSTLAVIAFPMGTWVGGVYTMSCLRHIAHKGHKLTTVTPGNKPEEIERAVTSMAPHFEQTVLCGYPPFVKSVIDGGRARGVQWESYNLKFVFAGEVFSEEWRALVAERAGLRDPTSGSSALYGTSDAGVLACETPVSVRVRQFFSTHPEEAAQFFGEHRLPAMGQYEPSTRFFEVVDGTLVVSAYGAAPLIRYHIADKGGVVEYHAMLDFLRQKGCDLTEMASAHPPLPFVYLFGRADFTVSFFGANVYPENITVGLEQEEVKHWVTGKFVVMVSEDSESSRDILRLVVELAPGTLPSNERALVVARSAHTHLIRLNSEFRNYVPQEYQMPVVELRPFGDAEYFPIGVKHRYTRK
eukprot:Colp12_sorted_trinity150504_noHs@14304